MDYNEKRPAIETGFGPMTDNVINYAINKITSDPVKNKLMVEIVNPVTKTIQRKIMLASLVLAFAFVVIVILLVIMIYKTTKLTKLTCQIKTEMNSIATSKPKTAFQE